MRRLVVFPLLFIVFASALGTVRAAAQHATPTTFPLTPDPAECQVAPRPPDEVLALVTGTPVAVASPAAGLPAAVGDEALLPEGQPSDAATTAAIVATARELIACNNAGDFARVLAFYTDDLIRQAFRADPAASEQLETILATPATPLPAAQRTVLLDVRDVRELPDGRVGAIVEDRDAQRTVVVFLIFERTGDRWLLDGQIEVQAVTPPVGTPAT
jgi:hypothetical protein